MSNAVADKVADSCPMPVLNEESLRVLIENIQVGVVLIDEATHKIIDINRKAEEMIGCPRGDILGNECHEFICPAKHGQCPITDLGLSVDNAERILIKWSGEKIPILKTVKRITVDGRSYILDSFVDLTEHRATQDALRESEGRFRTLFDNSTDAMMTLEPPAWTFTSGNPATLLMFGTRNLDEFLTYHPVDISPEMQPDGQYSTEKAKKMIEIALRGGFNHFEWTHRRMNGENFPANVLLTRITQGEKTYLHATVRDISEEKKAGTALKESEMRYRTLLEASFDLIYVIDRNDLVRYVNPAALRSLGKSSADVLGKPRESLFSPAIASSQKKGLEIVFKTGEPLFREQEIQFRNIIHWQETQLIPLKTPQGDVDVVMGISRDITERKNAEIALVKAKEEWERTFDAVPDLVSLIDCDHRIVRVNKPMAERLGITPEKAVGCFCYEVVHGLSAPPDFCPHQKLMVSGKEERAEVNEKRLGGVFDVSATPITDAEGHLVGCIHVARDITERKRVEIALGESEERFRAIFDNTKDGILVSNTNGKFLFSNLAMSEMLGYTPDELKDLKVTDIHPKKDLPAVMNVFTKAAGNEVKKVHDLPMLRKDGSVFYVNISGNIINLNGEACLVGVFRDITERKKMEVAMRENEAWVNSIFNALQTGVVVIDVETRTIAEVNPVAEKMLGVKRENIINEPCHRFFHSGIDKHCPILDDGMNLDNSERIMIDRHGNQVPILKNVVRATMNGRQYLVESFIDLTNQKKSEQALRESELKYRLLSENSSDVIWSIDLNGKFLYISPSVETLRGFTSEEVMKQPIEQVLMPEGIALFERELTAIFQSLNQNGELNHARIFEMEQPCKDGTTVWTEVSASLMCDETGVPIGLQGVSRDITERRKLESTMKAYLHDLERHKKATIDRELKMVELKEEMRSLKEKQQGG